MTPVARSRLAHENGTPKNVGELTYRLFKECLDYLPALHRYQDLAEVLGALEATKTEFYRRVVAPYEDKKIDANGDVL